jgi:hypothetical protein
MTSNRENHINMFSNFNPLIYGATFWQTLFTNWWYNVGRDLAKNATEMSKFWCNVYIRNLGETYSSLDRQNKDKVNRDQF